MNIKIVTAFFDIGRGSYSNMNRSDDKYFEYFKFWARIKNDLTIYCESKNAERIKEIRSSFGLEEKTHIICIDEFKSIEPHIYKRLKEIEKNENFKNFRFFNNALSNKADYCYIMCLKWWCLSNAAQNEDDNQMMAWLDFGYNHGGELYTNPNDFDFEWNYEFESKINKFCLCDPKSVCSIDNLQFQSDCFIGHTAIMPAHYCAKYWVEIKSAMLSLLQLDCMDDDQQLELMVYRNYPEWFEVRICNWFEDMKLCSNQSFEIKKGDTTSSFKSVIRNKVEKYRRKVSFYKRTRNRYLKYGR